MQVIEEGDWGSGGQQHGRVEVTSRISVVKGGAFLHGGITTPPTHVMPSIEEGHDYGHSCIPSGQASFPLCCGFTRT